VELGALFFITSYLKKVAKVAKVALPIFILCSGRYKQKSGYTFRGAAAYFVGMNNKCCRLQTHKQIQTERLPHGKRSVYEIMCSVSTIHA
jgi:hypothetical protein